nr:oxidoreductase-like domain-containing protein [uncultured Duganella sp.]
MTDDPKPQAPEPPAPGDCCHSGCTYCVEDLYQEELDRYREALKMWEARNPPNPGHSRASGNP